MKAIARRETRRREAERATFASPPFSAYFAAASLNGSRMVSMRNFLTVASFLVLCVLSGCVPPSAAPAAHPNLIIIRQFAFSPGIVALDPSLGFSLDRGSPGAPRRARAETVGRAAAFTLADTVTQQLAGLGYDVVRSDVATAEPGGRALVVSGAFRRIIEGYRRQNASVTVALEVAQQAGSGAPQHLGGFDLDSRTVAAPPPSATSAQRGGVNAAAERVAAAIARYVGDLARLNRWPAAQR